MSGSAKISKPGASPILALFTGIFFGTGHAYNGQVSKWAVVMAIQGVGYLLCILPGLFIHVLSVIDSYQIAERLEKGESIPENEYSFNLLYQIVKVIDKTATCGKA
ncbi:MAG: hypothetical protein LBC63_03900 [Holophagales bacterium]|jgi:hypothetical protein|nr:hypothetical protein [Holophagales bacterium]